MPDFSTADAEHVSLCEALDRILNKGAVVVGEVRISVADIDLIYLGLQIVLSSVETCRDGALTGDEISYRAKGSISEPVGWVERSETHQQLLLTDTCD